MKDIIWHLRNHLDSPTEKKQKKTVLSAKKIMGTVCWDAEGYILIEFLEPGKAINVSHYVQTLLKLRGALRDTATPRQNAKVGSGTLQTLPSKESKNEQI
jgi:hypothetical protein